jgi:hypothetical protein
MATIAKKASTGQSYVVANEVLCNGIARALVLPCPPGALMEEGGEDYFFSLDFNLAGHSLPPADAKVIVSKFPRLAWGIILFDAFIMNGDRHGRNIAYDASTDRVQIFDHSHAFLGADGDIPRRLASAADQLCIGGHCLASEVSTEDGLESWLGRIELIPDFFLEEMVEAASTVGLPAVYKSDAFAFIKNRRNDLCNIVNNHKGVFSKLPRVTP